MSAPFPLHWRRLKYYKNMPWFAWQQVWVKTTGWRAELNWNSEIVQNGQRILILLCWMLPIGNMLLKESFSVNFHGLKIVLTAETEIKRLINSHRSKHPLDYDGIICELLKTFITQISHPWSYIYNHWQNIHIFTDHLKIPIAKPLYKK